jgi:hypothetical protein
MALADFGSPHYGGVLKGQLVYPDAEFGWKVDCKPAGCNYGCVPFNVRGIWGRGLQGGDGVWLLWRWRPSTGSPYGPSPGT